MVQAKDSALLTRLQQSTRPGLALTCLAVGLLGTPGCAKFRNQKRGEPPILGSSTTDPKVDAYTAFDRSLAEQKAKMAARTRASQPPEDASRVAQAPPQSNPGDAPALDAPADARSAAAPPSAAVAADPAPAPRPVAVTRSTAHPRPRRTDAPIEEGPRIVLGPPIDLNTQPTSTTAPNPEPSLASTLVKPSAPLGPIATSRAPISGASTLPSPSPSMDKPKEPSAPGTGLDLTAPVAATPSAAPASKPASTKPVDPRAELARLVAEARTRLDAVQNYQVKVTGQERVGSTLRDPEVMVMSIRRQPKAVRLEWREGAQKGREVIYVSDRNGGLIHINVADSLVPVPRLTLAPNSPLVMKNGRHPITEAGFDQIVKNLELALNPAPGSPQTNAKLHYKGLESAKLLSRPHHLVVRITPNGEVWKVYLDPDTKLPALVEAHAADNTLLERYTFKDVKMDVPELLAGNAFDPDARWGKPSGLLSRLTRGGH